MVAVNSTLIDLYWSIGEYISGKIASEEWGKGTVAALADTIQRRFPGVAGYSPQNLWRMRQFFETYSHRTRLSPLVRELSWTHIPILSAATAALLGRSGKHSSAARYVVVVMIDALALHLASEAVGYLEDYLKEGPTWSSHLLTALPTITEVCKEAVLTGWRPDQCGGGLVSLLCKAYDLSEDQVQVAASWQDGERLQVAPGPAFWFIATTGWTTRCMVQSLITCCWTNRRACFDAWPNWWRVGSVISPA